MGVHLLLKKNALGAAGATWFAVMMGFCQPGVARAQDALGAGAASPVACELHVWPAPALETESEGAIRNHPRNFDLRDKDGRPTLFATALDQQTQQSVLQSLDLPRLLGLSGATLVMHEGPAPVIIAGQPLTRHTASDAPCYAELVLKHLVFEYASLAGSSLQTVYQFSVFGSGAAPLRSFSTMNATQLERYPDNGETGEAMASIWADALRQDTRKFAAAATAPPRRRR